MLLLIAPLFSFDNHFFGVTGATGTLTGDDTTVLKDEKFLSFGAKTGIVTDNVITYVDVTHLQFDREVDVDDRTDFNEDYLSFVIGPMFQLDLYFDTYIYLAGVASVDKFHYSKQINEYSNKYISKYQLFFGYEFGIIFPVILNPFDSTSDSFFEFGYRQSYNNSSLDNEDDQNFQGGFKEIGYYFAGLNVLF
jgi:hypothetical protein